MPGANIDLPYGLLIGTEKPSDNGGFFLNHLLAEDNHRLSDGHVLVVQDHLSPAPQGR